MLSTLTLVTALSVAPAQAGELNLANVRATYGVLGALRTSNKVLPGDVYHISFDIENLQADAEGKVMYQMGMELLNPQGQTEFKRAPDPKLPQELVNVFGGNRIPAFAYASTDPSYAAGTYTLKVTVIDDRTKKQKTLETKFDVLPKGFGLVDLVTTYDPRIPVPAPMLGVAGQVINLNFSIVGFEAPLDATKKQKKPNVSLEMKVLDANGQPTMKKPTFGDFKEEIQAGLDKIPMAFPMALNRAGKFTVELSATDKISGKTSKLTFPMEVLEQKATK
jgi:hypothetical protein